jgi:hypothetical protein
MSTTPTEAHIALVRNMAAQGYYLSSTIEHYAQLIADSEATAIRKQIEALEIAMRRWLNMEKERDQLRSEAERTAAIYQRACEVEHELRAELVTEREKAERYRLATLKLAAELAAKRARLDWLEMAEKTDHAHCPENDGQRWCFPYLMDGAGGFGGGVGHKYFDTLRAAIDAAMQEDAK